MFPLTSLLVRYIGCAENGKLKKNTQIFSPFSLTDYTHFAFFADFYDFVGRCPYTPTSYKKLKLFLIITCSIGSIGRWFVAKMFFYHPANKASYLFHTYFVKSRMF